LRVTDGAATRAVIGSIWRCCGTGQPTDYLFSKAADSAWNTLSLRFEELRRADNWLVVKRPNDGLNGSTGTAIDDVHTQICVPQ
jgi:hypothetical protein